jgi:glycosyltransferase involved in cell wall biosynthesis
MMRADNDASQEPAEQSAFQPSVARNRGGECVADGLRCAMAQQRMRIALVYESGEPGGAERMLLQLADRLRARGHYVLPVGPDDTDPWLHTELQQAGFEPATFHIRGPADPTCLATIIWHLRRHRIDVVNSHAFFAAVYGGAAAWLLRTPHVITMHGSRYHTRQQRRRTALRWSAKRSRAIVGVSAATASELADGLGLPRSAVQVVYNGVPNQPGDRERVRRELGLNPDEQLIVAVGSLFPVKGHAVLLRALELLRHDDVRGWRAAIAGIGGEEHSLRHFIDARSLDDRVTLLGFRRDVPDLLAAADIYVMPSLYEGSPLSLMEAMFAGKAIAASATGGIPELVSNAEEALLTNPGDASELAASLRLLLADPALRARLGVAARRRAASQFTLDRMTDEYEQLYAACMKEGTPGSLVQRA